MFSGATIHDGQLSCLMFWAQPRSGSFNPHCSRDAHQGTKHQNLNKEEIQKKQLLTSGKYSIFMTQYKCVSFDLVSTKPGGVIYTLPRYHDALNQTKHSTHITKGIKK